MTEPTTSPSRALVLSGGGPLGIAWMAGLATGLAQAGTPLVGTGQDGAGQDRAGRGGADAVVGTSAGAVVGAQLALGRDPMALLATLADSAGALAAGPPMDLAAFGEAMTGAAAAATPQEGRRVIGAAALRAVTVDQEAYVGVFAHLGDAPWPETFRCTAVDVDDGAPLVWEAASGVDLPRAVASSAAVPLVFPVIDVGGHRCMDGGLRSSFSADLAAGHDRVLVVSCTALVPGPGATPYALAMAATHAAELAGLRASGSAVEVIEPGPAFTAVSAGGANLFDFARARDAYDAGLGQSRDEAARVGALWAVWQRSRRPARPRSGSARAQLR